MKENPRMMVYLIATCILHSTMKISFSFRLLIAIMSELFFFFFVTNRAASISANNESPLVIDCV